MLLKVIFIKLPRLIMYKLKKVIYSFEGVISAATQYKKEANEFEKMIKQLNLKISMRSFVGAKEDYKKVKDLYNKLPTNLKSKYHNKLIIIYNVLSKVN